MGQEVIQTAREASQAWYLTVQPGRFSPQINTDEPDQRGSMQTLCRIRAHPCPVDSHITLSELYLYPVFFCALGVLRREHSEHRESG